METVPAHRFQTLDSLRGITACIIVLFHCQTQGIICNNPFVGHSFLLVDFFFVLSGFVISSGYTDKIAKGFAIGRFMFLRWGRIYPLHLVMLLAFAAFDVRLAIVGTSASAHPPFTGGHSPGAFVANLFLVQTFVGPDVATWNGVSWSIAAEFWTYLVFAILFRRLRVLLVPACLAVALGSAIYLLILNDHAIAVTHDGAFARCLYGFGMGVVADRLFSARLSGGTRLLGSAAATALESLTLAVVIAFVILAGESRWSLLGPIVYIMAIPVFALQGGAISRVLRTRPLLILGMLSYSIYMVHPLLYYRTVNIMEWLGRLTHRQLTYTYDTGLRVGGGELIGDAMSIAMLALTIATAWVTYHLIEEPGRLWSRRAAFFRPSPPTPAQA